MADNCQIPTPTEYAKIMLDYANYKTNLYSKKVLENSCGEGNILIEIVERYILDAKKIGYTILEIKRGLENDIYAYEIDREKIIICKNRLNETVKKYGIISVTWNIYKKDYLQINDILFDFIIGNPPYITYHDLNEKQRLLLHCNFISCKNGRFDYCYAFIEKSILSLSKNGVLVYLIPYSVLRNKYAKDIRKLILPILHRLYDYSGIQIFSNIISSSVIIVCSKNTDRNSFSYINIIENKTKIISKKDLIDKWFFVSKGNKQKRFGDYFIVLNSIATLYNDAFLLTNFFQDEQFTYVDNYSIENSLLKYAVSTKSMKKHIKDKGKDKIIFPYKICENGIRTYNEQEFKELYPGAYKYLYRNIDHLKKRKSDKNAKWYEYGRSQALKNIIGEKLIIPMVITNKVKVYKADKEDIPYAGYFIKKKEGSELGLDIAKNILESDEFYQYVKEHGTPTTLSSYRISVTEISNYKF